MFDRMREKRVAEVDRMVRSIVPPENRESVDRWTVPFAKNVATMLATGSLGPALQNLIADVYETDGPDVLQYVMQTIEPRMRQEIIRSGYTGLPIKEMDRRFEIAAHQGLATYLDICRTSPRPRSDDQYTATAAENRAPAGQVASEPPAERLEAPSPAATTLSTSAIPDWYAFMYARRSKMLVDPEPDPRSMLDIIANTDAGGLAAALIECGKELHAGRLEVDEMLASMAAVSIQHFAKFLVSPLPDRDKNLRTFVPAHLVVYGRLSEEGTTDWGLIQFVVIGVSGLKLGVENHVPHMEPGPEGITQLLSEVITGTRDAAIRQAVGSCLNPITPPAD